MTCPSCGGSLEAVVDLVGVTMAPSFHTLGSGALPVVMTLMKFFACNGCEYCIKATELVSALEGGRVA